MARSPRLLRRTALVGAVLLAAADLAPVHPAASQTYEPPPWDPPAGHNVTTVRWGPITIPAATSSGPGELDNQIATANCRFIPWNCISLPIQKPFSGDGYITGILPDLVYAGTDTSVNFDTGGMLHHVVNLNLSDPDVTCAPGFTNLINLVGLWFGGNERFFAAGNERTIGGISGPGNYGDFVDGDEQWALIYHLMNFQPEPIEVEFKYTFSWVRSGPTEVDPVWLDIDQCGDSEVSIPAGYSDRHWRTTAQQRGTVVGVGGHAHDHSIAVSVENNTKDLNYFTSVAGYAPDSPFAPVGPGPGTRGHPTAANEVTSTGHPNAPLEAHQGHISDFTTTTGTPISLPFDRGDEIEVHATYNHPTGADDAMGIMIAYVQFEDEQQCPWWAWWC